MSLTERIKQKGLDSVRGQTNVFEISRGMSSVAWKAVKATYKLGSSDGLAGWLYDRLRHGADYNEPSLMLNLMGSH